MLNSATKQQSDLPCPGCRKLMSDELWLGPIYCLNHRPISHNLPRARMVDVQSEAASAFASGPPTPTTTISKVSEKWQRTLSQEPITSETAVDLEWEAYVAKYRGILGEALEPRLINEWESSIFRLKAITLNAALVKRNDPEEICETRISLWQVYGMKLVEDYDCLFVVQPPKGSIPSGMTLLASKGILTAASPILGSDIKPCRLADSTLSGDHMGENKANFKQIKWSLEIESDLEISTIHQVMKYIHFSSTTDSEDDVTWQQLVQISSFCKKFNLQRALRPYTRIWISSYSPKALDCGSEDWLHITEAFNSTVMVSELIEVLSDGLCYFDPDRSCILVDVGENCDLEFEPGDETNTRVIRTGLWSRAIIDRLLSSRNKKLQHLLARLRIIVGLLEPRSRLKSPILCDSPQCINLAYGSIIESLHETDLEEKIRGLPWTRSVANLREQLRKVKLETLKSINSSHSCLIYSIGENIGKYVGAGIPDGNLGFGEIRNYEYNEIQERIQVLNQERLKNDLALEVQKATPMYAVPTTKGYII